MGFSCSFGDYLLERGGGNEISGNFFPNMTLGDGGKKLGEIILLFG